MDRPMDRSRHALSDQLTEVARQRLARSPYLTIRSVSCEYDAGLLRLQGRVPTFYHKQLAQEAVADLRGVLQVLNQTEVTSPTS
jgi:osmotically-inducible protein OsmY